MLDNVLVCNSSRQKQLWLLYPWFSTGEIPQPSRLPLNLCLSPESVEQQFIRKALLHTKMLTQLSDFTVTKSPSLNSVPLGARSSGRGLISKGWRMRWPRPASFTQCPLPSGKVGPFQGTNKIKQQQIDDDSRVSNIQEPHIRVPKIMGDGDGGMRKTEQR